MLDRNNKEVSIEDRKFKISRPYFDLEFKVIGKINKDEGKILRNPSGNPLIHLLYSYLNSNFQNIEVIDSLVNFYIYYIYPLENFLKTNNDSVKELDSDGMFDFSNFDIDNYNNSIVSETVGKVKGYSIELDKLYENLSKLLEKKHKNKNIVGIDDEIDKLMDLFLSENISKFYLYSKNRSRIEHIRCSIMHGGCWYDNKNNSFLLTDKYKNAVTYKEEISLADFNRLLSRKNTDLIEEQYNKIKR